MASRFLLTILSILLTACPRATPPGSEEAVTHPRQELEVSFPGTDFELEGVLSLPAREEGTRVPALLLIHGSGPIDRDI